MEIYLSLIVPVIYTITILVLYFLGKIKLSSDSGAKLILFLPVFFVLMMVFILKYTSTSVATRDTEYLNYFVTEIRYYEPWDEWIDETCTRTCCCDSEGKNCGTETYDCSYRKQHYEKFTAILNNGDEITISEDMYNKYLKLNNNKKFVDMNRDYYRQDGDMYSTIWNGLNESFLLNTVESTYKNKVQASHDVFNFPDIDKNTARELQLFDYPQITRFNTNTILHDSSIIIPHSTQVNYNKINGMLGMDKQLRLWVIVTSNKPESWTNEQEAYWKGGNKNEFIIIINVDKYNMVKWTRCITWCENQSLKRVVSQTFTKGEKLDLDANASVVMTLLQTNFKRKEFKDFDYLQVDVPLWADLTAMVLSLLITLGSYILLRKQSY